MKRRSGRSRHRTERWRNTGGNGTSPAPPNPAAGVARRPRKLQYVIQKHAASHLHFDLRLELDGVMKSWAVPKGPSLDPSVKRLAMQVEDHPIEYNTFEGTIPKGEYGGGTVMVWDRGTYTYGGDEDRDPEEALRHGYARGDFKFELHGKRLKGSWVLVRTRRGDPKRPQWLLIKHRDESAEPGSRGGRRVPDLGRDRPHDGRDRGGQEARARRRAAR